MTLAPFRRDSPAVRSHLSGTAGLGTAVPGTAPPPRAPARSGRERSPKLAAQVAQRIEADIATAGWPVGQVFGSENDLRERYGVSRAVLREAVRLVEHHEVAAMRRGPSGGLVVLAPDATPLTAALVIYLEYIEASVEDLLAARLLLEPLAARLAAGRLTEAGIIRLRRALPVEPASAGQPGGTGHDQLHLTLGQLSGNPALNLFIDVLVQLTDIYAESPTAPGPAEVEAVNRESARAHHALADAIIAGDEAQAEHRATRHLEAVREQMVSIAQRPITRSPRPRPGPGVGDGDRVGVGVGVGKRKLAETIARRMIADIARIGAKTGDVVGSEPELLARLDVSRAVFREAVRILEYHSVAEMRRGPGGGLVVAEPDPSASIEAAAIYLDYQKIGLADLRSVRGAIELGALDRVAARRDDREVARRLGEALVLEPGTGWAEIGERAHGLHAAIAEESGNPILALFLRIIIGVWARHLPAPDDASHPGSTPDEVVEVVNRAHRPVVEAILAGDVPLARHRMNRHLSALSNWWH